MAYRTYLFDLDGTLIDSHRDIAGALNDVLARLDCPTHDPEEVKTMIGGGVSTLLERGLGPARLGRLEEARALFKDAYSARLVETTALYDGVAEMLQRLAEGGVTAAIATNKPSFFTDRIVSHLRLADLGVVAVASSDEVPSKKPDPAVVRLAMRRAGATEALAYVGDMPVDVQTARGAQLWAVAVSWGFDPRGLVEAAPDEIADAPGKLGELILGRG